MKQKYVITNQGLPILFDQALIHSSVATHYNVQSAGFFSTTINTETNRIEVTCWGESSSLHIRSNPKGDKILIEELLNG